MSAPVVAVTINARGGVMPATPRPWDGDLPALAVPDALWGDSAFNDAVRERLAWNYGHVSADMMAAFLAAIHAELRARAGGAE